MNPHTSPTAARRFIAFGLLLLPPLFLFQFQLAEHGKLGLMPVVWSLIVMAAACFPLRPGANMTFRLVTPLVALWGGIWSGFPTVWAQVRIYLVALLIVALFEMFMRWLYDRDMRAIAREGCVPIEATRAHEAHDTPAESNGEQA